MLRYDSSGAAIGARKPLETQELSENIRTAEWKCEIPTPALVLDLDAFERNLARMADAVKRSGKRLRPHAKAHKCPEIAKRQIAAGACGMCVATVSEAEMMASAEVGGLLLTSPLADVRKMRRLPKTGAIVTVDHVRQVEWLEQAEANFDVLVDLDVGDHRTGARSIDQAVAIAQAVDRAPKLTLLGIQAYSVRGSHGGDHEERRQISEAAFAIAAEARDAFRRAGLRCGIISGGSTGTWDIDLALPALTELQAGSYPLMDLAYRRLGVDFENALHVLTTVVSANHADFVTVDGGFKAFSTDRGYGPEPVDLRGAGYRWGGDEFGFIDLIECDRKPKLGDRIEFIPPHCDPTVNLYRCIYGCRGDRVEEVWPVG
jgi:D-serine deaminase-like pyridoxal phosphate-dependent protein